MPLTDILAKRVVILNGLDNIRYVVPSASAKTLIINRINEFYDALLAEDLANGGTRQAILENSRTLALGVFDVHTPEEENEAWRRERVQSCIDAIRRDLYWVTPRVRHKPTDTISLSEQVVVTKVM